VSVAVRLAVTVGSTFEGSISWSNRMKMVGRKPQACSSSDPSECEATPVLTVVNEKTRSSANAAPCIVDDNQLIMWLFFQGT